MNRCPVPGIRLRLMIVLPLLAAAGARAAPFTFISHPASGSLSVVDAATGAVLGPLSLAGAGTAVAASPDGARIWVAVSDTGRLAALDAATGAVETVAVGAGPAGVAVHPSGAWVYVVNAGDGTVTMVDGTSMTALATAAVGANPAAVAVDAARVYVANLGDDSVSVLDAATLAPLSTVAVGGFPAGLAVGPAANRLWVANHFDGTVSVVDTALGTVIDTVPVGPGPRGVVVDAAGTRVYVANFGGGSVSMLDAVTGATLATAPSGGSNPTDLVLTPSGDRLFVVHLASPGLGVLDTTTLAPLATVPLDAGHLAASPFVGQAPPFGQSVTEVPTLSDWGLVCLAAGLAGVALARTPRGRATALALALGCSHPTAALAQPLELYDGELDEADWQECAASPPATGTHTASRVSSGGNPGAYREMQHLAESETALEVTHCYVGAGGVYEPGTSGAVGTIDVSWDRRLLASDPGGPVDEAFVLRQGGDTFRAAASSFTSAAWEPFSAVGLTAADFAGGPDLSAAGAPISFGFVRSTSAAAGTAFHRHAIDNFTVTVTPAGPGNAGVLRFAFPVQALVDGDEALIVVRRVGGDEGAVGALVRIPMPGGTADAVAAVSWGDGESGDRLVPSPFTGGLIEDIEIFESHMTLAPPTGGAVLHPHLAKAILLVGSPEAGPALAFLALAQALFASADAWWLAAAAPLAVYLALLRRRQASQPAAAPPTEPQR